jgi:hypothetical protein
MAAMNPSPTKPVVRFPTALLEDDRMVRRVWAGDRKDQDLYNADRKYSGGSTEHPILVRRYLFPEDGYEPLATGTPDSQFPEAVVVEEEEGCSRLPSPFSVAQLWFMATATA